MKKLLYASLAAVAAVTVLAAESRAQAKDPVLGTWVLNVAKSTGPAGAMPKSGTRTYTAAGDKISMVAEIVGADGKTAKTEFSTAADGKDYAYKGDANYDMISIKRIDANSIESTLKKGGKVVSTANRVVSKDGKTMTITLNAKDAKGAAVKTVSVWNKK